MKIKELFDRYVNQENHERQIGRYWASDIYQIKKGYLRPGNFFEKKKVDEKGVRMILVGEAMESQLQKIFEFNKVKSGYQNKYEIKIKDDIVLVVKPDFEFDNFVIETKFPFSPVVDEIPERYLYQLEAEYRATNKDVYLGVLEIPFKLRLIKYKPLWARWEEIKDILIKFDEDLRKINSKK